MFLMAIPKKMCNFLFLAGLAIFFLSMGCSHNIVKIDMPVAPSKLGILQEGKSDCQAVLNHLGPPIKVIPYRNGFLFVYASYKSNEGQLMLSYGQSGVKGKFDISSAINSEQLGLFYFNEKGILQQCALSENKARPGWGASVGPIILDFDLIENPFFEKYDYYHQEHVPVVSSLLEKYPRGPKRREAKNLKYIESKETDEIDSRLLESSHKRWNRIHQKKDMISIKFSSEIQESSNFQWQEIKEEMEIPSFEKTIPYASSIDRENP